MMIDATIFVQKRQKLASQLADNSLVLLMAAPNSEFAPGVSYPFHQDSYFYYLTGSTEATACLILLKQSEQLSSLLFVVDNEPTDELWHGKRLGVAQAKSYYQVDRTYLFSDLSAQLDALLPDYQTIYCNLDEAKSRPLVCDLFRKQSDRNKLIEIRDSINSMRLIKDQHEVDALTRAVNISTQAHQTVMQRCVPGLYEYQLEASFIGHTLELGARHQAYPPIVASGSNTCTLHYTKNNKQLQDGELLLIDAACEYEHYTADITRTYPVNGRFSPQQAALYDLVLTAQEAAIAVIRPETPFDLIHKTAVKILAQGLINLGLLQGFLAEVIKTESYKTFYPHGTSHWLGLDVHDVGGYKIGDEPRLLQKNMLLTVEPGLYISATSSADKQWHNIGIRIEDDILVTATGSIVLSAGVPKVRQEIESLMVGRKLP